MRFEIGAYDTTQTQVIDPILMSSFYGNNIGNDGLHDVKVGTGVGTQFAVFTGYAAGLLGFDTSLIVGRINLNPVAEGFAGPPVLQEDIFRGSGTSIGRGIAMNPNNKDLVYVVGDTTAKDFPLFGSIRRHHHRVWLWGRLRSVCWSSGFRRGRDSIAGLPDSEPLPWRWSLRWTMGPI